MTWKWYYGKKKNLTRELKVGPNDNKVQINVWVGIRKIWIFALHINQDIQTDIPWISLGGHLGWYSMCQISPIMTFDNLIFENYVDIKNVDIQLGYEG